MIPIIIILLITGYSTAHFYLKFSPIISFITLMSAIFASIITFNFYEMLATLFITRGYGGPWATAGCFLVLFVIGFTLLRELFSRLAGGNIDLGNNVKIASAVLLGILTGLIISGNVLVAIGMLPVQSSWAYNRFPDTAIALNSPQKALLNPDGMVSSLFSIISRGSLSSSKSFAVLSADFINRNHLNRHGLNQNVSTVASRKALSVPGGDKKPVRKMEIPDLGSATVVRIRLLHRDVVDGGARNDAGLVSFTPAQFQMILKPVEKANNFKGKGEAIYPVGILEDGKFVKKELADVLAFTNENVDEDQTIAVDLVFNNIPADKKAVLLSFKASAITVLPDSVVSSDEIEKNLGSIKSQPREDGN